MCSSPTGASLKRTTKVADKLSEAIKEIPGVKDVMAISGFSFMSGGAGSNLAALNVILDPWEKRGRTESLDNIMAKVDEISAGIQEAEIFSINPPAIPGFGMSGGLEMQLLDASNLGAAEMMKALGDVIAAAQKDPAIASATTMYQGLVPQYQLNFDRDRIRLEGITLDQVYSTLSTYMGGNYVNDFVDFGRVFQVNVMGTGESRSKIDDIMELSVRNTEGNTSVS